MFESDENKILGYFNGYIKQGRNPNIGIFIGLCYNLDNNEIGSLKGFYKGKNIFGVFSDFESKITSFFFGITTFNDSHYNADLFIKKFGLIHCSGLHKESFLPMLTGEFDVGVINMHLIDENRYEKFTEDDPNDYREMIVQLWYPVNKSTYGDRIEYMDSFTFDWLFGRSPVPLITIPKNAYEYVRPYSLKNPQIASNSNIFPVIIFSHGYDGVYQIYTSLIEDIVSHGFIVASINHPYIAGITVFPDGRMVNVSPVIENVSIQSVVGDVNFVLDLLFEMNVTNQILAGKMDLSKVGMYGHSFGGAATAICCYDDSRITAGLTLDGVVYEEYINEDFNKPFLMMLAEGHSISSGSKHLWNLLEDEVYKVEVMGSTHYGYTDIGLLLKHLIPLIPANLLDFGTINAKRLVNITKSYEIAFFETYLKGQPIENLINLSSKYYEVIFEYK